MYPELVSNGTVSLMATRQEHLFFSCLHSFFEAVFFFSICNKFLEGYQIKIVTEFFILIKKHLILESSAYKIYSWDFSHLLYYFSNSNSIYHLFLEKQGFERRWVILDIRTYKSIMIKVATINNGKAG